MKRLKTAITFLLGALVCIAAAACKENPETPSNQLAAPQNLRIVNNKLIWDSVANATGYTVSYYGADYETTNSYCDLYIYSQESVTFEVYARGDGENRTDSEKASLTSNVSSNNLTTGLTYTLNAEGTGYTVSGNNENLSGKVVIADYYAGLPVTAVAKKAFKRTAQVSSGWLVSNTTIDNETLTGVRLPVTLESIGDEAFFKCVALTEITIPEGVTAIEVTTFQNCTKLKTVRLPSTLEVIKTGAFRNCTALKTINFPASLKSIFSQAFSGCTSLKKPSLPDSVDVYAMAFFYSIVSLSSVSCGSLSSSGGASSAIATSSTGSGSSTPSPVPAPTRVRFL